MKTFKDFLEEARKNPEMNPKIHLLDALRKYKDVKDIFVSFTAIDKIGINPSSNHSTPNGIYTYPLKEMWKQIVDNRIPWAGQEPFIWVLKKKPGINFIEDLYKDYSSKIFDEDVKKIKEICSSIKDKIDNEIIPEAIKSAKVKGPAYIFINLTRIISDEYPKAFGGGIKWAYHLGSSTSRWNALLRALGYDGMADRSGKGIIHISEPTQAFFLHSRAFSVVEKVRNIRPAGKDDWKNRKMIEPDLEFDWDDSNI